MSLFEDECECVACGCSDHAACIDDRTGETCSWIFCDPDLGIGLCSFCEDDEDVYNERWAEAVAEIEEAEE